MTGLVALDRVAGDADQLAQFVLDNRGLLALAVHDAADAGLEQEAECLATIAHAGVPLR
jgi:hypothetical protein